MLYVKVMGNVAQHLLHVACNGGVVIRDECGYQNHTAQQKFHALLEAHEFHGRTASWLVSLWIIIRKKVRRSHTHPLVSLEWTKISTLWGARVAQWWEHSLSTNVARVQLPASTPYLGWVCCWFSPLLQEVFLRVLRFSPLHKNQHFQIPIRPGIRQTNNHYVDVLPANRYLFIYLFI